MAYAFKEMITTYWNFQKVLLNGNGVASILLKKSTTPLPKQFRRNFKSQSSCCGNEVQSLTKDIVSCKSCSTSAFLSPSIHSAKHDRKHSTHSHLFKDCTITPMWGCSMHKQLSTRTGRPREFKKEKQIEQKYEESYSRTRRYTDREDESASQDASSLMVDEHDEADIFGTLADKDQRGRRRDRFGRSIFDEEAIKEEEEGWIRQRLSKNEPIWYAMQMKRLVKEGKLADAIDMLETRMLKEDRVQPTEYIYNILIGGCGRAGYTEKAFKLYNNMKKRGLEPMDMTFTALFNSCAESPWPDTDGITRLRKLHRQILEKNLKLNLITYHAMIKAYGKCGDLQAASELFAHLLRSGTASAKSFNFLLFACISNKEAGMTYAIEFWRQMMAYGIAPDNYTHNLLLRITRECEIGDPSWANQILLKPVDPPGSKRLPSVHGKKGKKDVKSLTRGKDGRLLSDKQKEKMIPVELVPVTNLFDGVDGEYHKRDEMQVLEEEERIGLGPGYRDYLSWVAQDEVDFREGGQRTKKTEMNWWDDPKDFESCNSKTDPVSSVNSQTLPYTKTGTRRVQVNDTNVSNLPSVVDNESLPRLLDPKADLQNVESLSDIRSPSDRLALLGGMKGILESMASFKIKPDVKTFSLLAGIVPLKTSEEETLMEAVKEHSVTVDVDFYNVIIRRRTKRNDLKNAKKVLGEILQQGLFPNIRTFVNLATGHRNAQEGMQIIKDVKAAGLKPSPLLYGVLLSAGRKRKDYEYLRQLMIQMEEDKVIVNEIILVELEMATKHGRKSRQEQFGENMSAEAGQKLNAFRAHYGHWLKEMKAETIEQHPWDRFKRPSRGDGSEDDRR